MLPHKVLAALIELKPYHTLGLCYQFEKKTNELLYKAYPSFEKTLRTWPLYTGILDYPIPDPTGRYCPQEIFTNKDLWIPEYRDLRAQLLDHLIATLRTHIRKNPYTYVEQTDAAIFDVSTHKPKDIFPELEHKHSRDLNLGD